MFFAGLVELSQPRPFELAMRDATRVSWPGPRSAAECRAFLAAYDLLKVSSMRWRWLLAMSSSLLLNPGCFFMDCEDDLYGVRTGDRYRSTIVKHIEPANGVGSSTCPTAIDLVPGTTIDWSASLEGPGDGCDDSARVDASIISSGTLSGSSLALSSGCTVDWRAEVVPAGSSEATLTSTMDPAKPSWVLRRSFSVRGAGAACFSDGVAPSSCYDEFVITSTKL